MTDALVIAGRTFTFLDLFRYLGEFLPSFRRLLVAIFFEKIRAIIEYSSVNEPRHRSQFVANGVVLDAARQKLFDFVLFEILL